MKKIVFSTFLLANVSLNGFSQVGTTDSYCGKPIYGAYDAIIDGNLVDGLKVANSRDTTNTNVKKVVKKFGSHQLTFSYQDAPHMRNISHAAKMLESKGEKLCVEGVAEELSQWKTPIIVIPSLSN